MSKYIVVTQLPYARGKDMDLQGRKIKIKTINGIQYAYDMKTVWDKENKKYGKKSTYLGKVADLETMEIIPKREKFPTPKMILNFGDCYSIANNWYAIKGLGKQAY